MADNDAGARAVPSHARIAARSIAALGVLQILSMVHFLFHNFGDALTERGISVAEVNVTKAQVRAFSPQLADYISHLHIAIAGYGMAIGLATALLAWFGIQHGVRWTWWTAVSILLVASAIGIPAHFPYHLATPGHLGPPFLLLGAFAIAAALCYPRRQTA